jgi:Tol biopolymer transport system component
MLWSEAERKEEPLTELSTAPGAPYDWTADGKSVLASEWKGAGRSEIWQLPLDAAPNAEAAAVRIASNPMYDLWQPHFSPDERWIVFGAAAVQPSKEETTIYVVPKDGGAWVPITEKNHWYDKPRWSPDGKTIYYVMDQNGFFNVWGTHFDPARGKPVGQPFQVTKFDSPKLMFPLLIEPVEISIGGNKLALTLEEASGSIWMLDNVDR